jgi:hypothetical protein
MALWRLLRKGDREMVTGSEGARRRGGGRGLRRLNLLLDVVLFNEYYLDHEWRLMSSYWGKEGIDTAPSFFHALLLGRRPQILEFRHSLDFARLSCHCKCPVFCGNSGLRWYRDGKMVLARAVLLTQTFQGFIGIQERSDGRLTRIDFGSFERASIAMGDLEAAGNGDNDWSNKARLMWRKEGAVRIARYSWARHDNYILRIRGTGSS